MKKQMLIFFVTVLLLLLSIGCLVSMKAINESNETLKQADAFIEQVRAEPVNFVMLTPEQELETVPEPEQEYYISDYEIGLLAYMVYGEADMGHDDYYADYLQACTALNRLDLGWGSSITEVIYQPGQYETWFYEDLMYRGDYPSDTAWQAVYDAITCNTSPDGLIFADCRDSIPDGCYLFYEAANGQRFYCLY